MNVSKNNYYFWFKRLRVNHDDWHDLTNRPEIVDGSRRKADNQSCHFARKTLQIFAR